MLAFVVVPWLSVAVTVTVYALFGFSVPSPRMTTCVPLVPVGTVLSENVWEFPATVMENAASPV